ncbi:DUF6795 domain-containing protein [Pseudoalteromonas sp. L21]|uniref:DUF6795 domain-containing protein n=1 Tax=Pseudoalteromonas sp. L21 TaxID=1539746 RepID=UPI001F3731F1|nr:DUF6795 domain-containing protein [Pseudoalteromonas sp. L21]MCF7518738.1 hypothetical protein [Pseudoalteromonas sp. L21]
MSLLESFKKLGNYFGAYKVHLCPEVKGQVSENDQPLINAKIERRLRFSDGKYVEDFAYTDDKGGFSFPEVNIRSNQPAVPFAEIFTSQSLLLTHKSKEYCLWGARLSGFSYREEYAKKLGCLVADISSDKVLFKFENTKVEGYTFEAVSIGRWDKDFEILEQSDYFDLSEIEED